MVVGGHTTEALRLISALDFSRYTPRIYVISEGDDLSAQKAMTLEANTVNTFLKRKTFGWKFTALLTFLENRSLLNIDYSPSAKSSPTTPGSHSHCDIFINSLPALRYNRTVDLSWE